MRDRFIPRILRQEPDSLLVVERGNFDPGAIVDATMIGEMPGGDMERSFGIGTIEVALWNAMAKIKEKPLIAERFGGGAPAERMFCYVNGGWHPYAYIAGTSGMILNQWIQEVTKVWVNPSGNIFLTNIRRVYENKYKDPMANDFVPRISFLGPNLPAQPKTVKWTLGILHLAIQLRKYAETTRIYRREPQ